MNLPTIAQIGTVGGLVAYLRTLASSIAAGWNVEHGSDGRHNWNWQTPAKDAARFSGGGSLVWTVPAASILVEEYGLMGDVMVWRGQIAATTTSGTAHAILRIALPGGYVVKSNSVDAVAYANDNGAPVPAFAASTAGARMVEIVKQSGGTWSNASAANTYIYFQFFLRVTKP